MALLVLTIHNYTSFIHFLCLGKQYPLDRGEASCRGSRVHVGRRSGAPGPRRGCGPISAVGRCTCDSCRGPAERAGVRRARPCPPSLSRSSLRAFLHRSCALDADAPATAPPARGCSRRHRFACCVSALGQCAHLRVLLAAGHQTHTHASAAVASMRCPRPRTVPIAYDAQRKEKHREARRQPHW